MYEKKGIKMEALAKNFWWDKMGETAIKSKLQGSSNHRVWLHTPPQLGALSLTIKALLRIDRIPAGVLRHKDF